MELRFQKDRDVTRFERQVYNMFMFLGDIGGFSGLVTSIIASIQSIVNYHKPKKIIIAELYYSNSFD